jgi:hypothetical protein
LASIFNDAFKRKLETSQEKFLGVIGSYCRTIMQRSIRRSSKYMKKSQPGAPPIAHARSGYIFKKGIAFDVKANEKAVYIGSLRMPDLKLAETGQTVPGAMENGMRRHKETIVSQNWLSFLGKTDKKNITDYNIMVKMIGRPAPIRIGLTGSAVPVFSNYLQQTVYVQYATILNMNMARRSIEIMYKYFGTPTFEANVTVAPRPFARPALIMTLQTQLDKAIKQGFKSLQ